MIASREARAEPLGVGKRSGGIVAGAVLVRRTVTNDRIARMAALGDRFLCRRFSFALPVWPVCVTATIGTATAAVTVAAVVSAAVAASVQCCCFCSGNAEGTRAISCSFQAHQARHWQESRSRRRKRGVSAGDGRGGMRMPYEAHSISNEKRGKSARNRLTDEDVRQQNREQ